MHRTYSHIFLKYKSIWLEENKRQCTVCHRLRTLDYFHILRSAKDGYKDRCLDCVTLNKESILSPKFDWFKTRTHKYCMACGQEKLINNFVASPNFTLDGLAYVCKECDSNYQPISKDQTKYHRIRHANIKETKPIQYQNERNKANKRKKERYANDPKYRETVKNSSAKFRQNNPEKIKNSRKLDYEKHKDKRLARQADWRRKKPEKVKLYNDTYPKLKPELVAASKKSWAINNRDKAKASEHKSRTNNRAKLAELVKKRQNIKYISQSNYSNNDIIRKKLYQDNCCYYCNSSMNNTETIEHIIPINLIPDNSSPNIILTCRSCNSSKQDKILHLEWNPPQSKSEPLYLHLSSILKEIQIWLQSQGIISELINSTRLTIAKNKLNIYFISLFWDSERFISKEQITTKSNESDYTNLYFFEDEWEFNKLACKNLIAHKLHLSNKIGARKTQLDLNVSFSEADLFLKENHVFQSNTHGQYRIGLRYNNKLVGLSTFTRSGITPHSKEDSIEWSRLCFSQSVVGGASKLLTTFINEYPQFKTIITYADLMKSSGDLYLKLGFDLINTPMIDYQYIRDFKRERKRRFQHKNMLSRLSYYNPKLTELGNTKANGIYRIWTPGVAKFSLSL